MVAELRNDLDWAIEARDQSNRFKKQWIVRYRELADRREYGEKSLAEYDPDLWFAGAIKEDVRGLRDRGDFTLARWDPLTDVSTWKDSKNYHQTPWYCFQQAVKENEA